MISFFNKGQIHFIWFAFLLFWGFDDICNQLELKKERVEDQNSYYKDEKSFIEKYSSIIILAVFEAVLIAVILGLMVILKK